MIKLNERFGIHDVENTHCIDLVLLGLASAVTVVCFDIRCLDSDWEEDPFEIWDKSVEVPPNIMTAYKMFCMRKRIGGIND